MIARSKAFVEPNKKKIRRKERGNEICRVELVSRVFPPSPPRCMHVVQQCRFFFFFFCFVIITHQDFNYRAGTERDVSLFWALLLLFPSCSWILFFVYGKSRTASWIFSFFLVLCASVLTCFRVLRFFLSFRRSLGWGWGLNPRGGFGSYRNIIARRWRVENHGVVQEASFYPIGCAPARGNTFLATLRGSALTHCHFNFNPPGVWIGKNGEAKRLRAMLRLPRYCA